MNFLDVTARNVLSHKETFIEFKNNRIQIDGENGAGKTSITVDALLWALFGQARGATTDQLKGPWDTTMSVIVRFVIGGKTYKVTRIRGSKSDLILYNETDKIDHSEKHIAMTQAKINELLGSENAFTSTVIFKQGDGLKFALMSAAERGHLIDELTGIEEFSEIEKRARQSLRASETERSRLDVEVNRLNAAQSEVETVKLSRSGLEAQLAIVEADLQKAEEAERNADTKLSGLQASFTKRSKFESDQREAELALVRLEGKLDNARTALDRITDQIEEIRKGSTCPTCGAELDAYHPATIAKINSYSANVAVLQDEVTQLEARVEAAKEDAEHTKRIAAAADIAIKNEYSAAERAKQLARSTLSALRVQQSTLTGQLTQMDTRIQVLSRELPFLPQFKDELDEQKLKIKGYELIAEAFSKRGIPRELKRGFVTEIEKAANALLVGLTDMTVRLSLEKDGATKSGVTEGTMDVWVKDRAGERKVEMLSGGEKMRIMLAIRLATAQAMSKKHDRALRTLILDESLDGLDRSGKDAALTMIESLSNFEKLLFITHDPSVAGAFPDKITLVKTADGSSKVA